MSIHQFPRLVPIPRTCSHHHRREPSQLPPFLPRCNTTSLQAHLGNRFFSPATNPPRSINLEARKSFSARIQLRVSAARAPVMFVSGRGCTLREVEGREYLDMAAGIAVNSFGHSDLNCVRVVTEQAATLTHVSNDFHSTPQVELAKRLVGCSFGDRVFFTNSGTEANEAAIKFARKFQKLSHPDEKNAAKEFISFTNCSKGRIMGAFALTRKEHYISPFEPVMPGVTFLEYGDIDAARQAIQRGKTAGVFVEPIHGEGAIYSATKEFLQALRKSCDDADALLVFDEVQCGPGRSGILSAHEAYGVVPDIMTLGKSLAGCLPIGAVLTTEKVAAAIKPWDHGSTFAILSDSTKSCFCNRH